MISPHRFKGTGNPSSPAASTSSPNPLSATVRAPPPSPAPVIVASTLTGASTPPHPPEHEPDHEAASLPARFRRFPSVTLSDGEPELGEFSPLPQEIRELQQAWLRSSRSYKAADGVQEQSSWVRPSEPLAAMQPESDPVEVVDDLERDKQRYVLLEEALEQSNAKREALASALREAQAEADRASAEAELTMQSEIERTEAKFKREIDFIRRGADAAMMERDRALAQARSLQERAVAWAVRDATRHLKQAEAERQQHANDVHLRALNEERSKTELLKARMEALMQQGTVCEASSSTSSAEAVSELTSCAQKLADEVLRVARIAGWHKGDVLRKSDVGWRVEDALHLLSGLSTSDIQGRHPRDRSFEELSD